MARRPVAGSLQKTTCSCSAPASKGSTARWSGWRSLRSVGSAGVASVIGGCPFRSVGRPRGWVVVGEPQGWRGSPRSYGPPRRGDRQTSLSARIPSATLRSSASSAAETAASSPCDAAVSTGAAAAPTRESPRLSALPLSWWAIAATSSRSDVSWAARSRESVSSIRERNEDAGAVEEADAVSHQLPEHLDAIGIQDRPALLLRRSRGRSLGRSDSAGGPGRRGAACVARRPPGQQSGQGVAVDRLGEEVVHPGAQAPLTLAR